MQHSDVNAPQSTGRRSASVSDAETGVTETAGAGAVLPTVASEQTRVLVIDDTEAIHNDFRKILQQTGTPDLDASEAMLFGAPQSGRLRTGFRLDSAYQGEEGLQMLKRATAVGEPYAIAFVDVRMPPGWDGVETAGHLWTTYPDLQIVICTAYSDYSWEEMIERLGHSSNLLFLKKPFDSVEVLQLAHSLSEKWRLTQWSRRQLADLDLLVNERTQELRHRVEMENLVSTLSTSFIHLPPAEVNAAVNQALRTVGEFVGADRSYVFCLAPSGLTGDGTHEWSAPGVESLLARFNNMSVQPFGWWMRRLRLMESIWLSSLNDLPPEADAEKALLESVGVKAAVAVPLVYGQTLKGFLGFDSLRAERHWKQTDAGLLKTVGEIIANALQHKLAAERVSRLNRLYSVLSKFNELVIRARSLEMLYDEACRIVVEDGLFRMAWIGLVEASSGRVKPVAHAGFLDGYLQGINVSARADIPEGLGPVGTAIRERRYDICNQAEQDPRLGPWRSELLRRGFRSIASFPLVAKGMSLGALTLYSGESHFFTDEEIRLLQQLAADLSFAGEFLQQKKELQLQGAALESAANSIVLTDAQGTVLWHNSAFTQLTGYGAAEVIGCKLSLLKSGKHGKDFYQHLWRTVASGRVWRGEITNRRKDGTLYTEEMTITPVLGDDGEITHFIAIKQDITERKRAEGRLAAFAALGQQLSTAKTTKEVARTIVELADEWLGWDACMCDLYSPTDDLVSHVLSIDLVDGQRTECLPARNHLRPSGLARRAILEGGQLVLRESSRETTSDTEPFGDPARQSASILYVPIRNGVAVTGLLSIQSYTQHAYDQRSLDSLQALADQCGGALDRIRTEDALRNAQEQLRQSQKMEAIGQLAAGVAHDFNNLLAVIRGNTELVLMGRGRFKGDPNECLKQVTAAADRAANLTRQLLMFGRKQVLQPQLLNLNEVVGNLAKMLKRIIGEDILLQCLFASQLPLIRADLGMMEQVLLNLVVNARDAMPRGGQLLVETSTASFDAAYARAHPEARAGNFVVLSVNDNGSGIEPEFLPRIFEPFFTTKEFGKGTGLGLATVYGIAKQHDGWIDVVSLVGVGSTFKVFLPIAESEVPASPEPPAEPLPQGGCETILLVEDDDGVRELTRLLLESYGYHVHEAPSGRDALTLWQTFGNEVDLLLTDIIMPHGVNGRELAERLCAERPGLKVILMSGYSGDTLDTEFQQRIQAPFLQKPCSAREILQTVRLTLDAQKGSQENFSSC